MGLRDLVPKEFLLGSGVCYRLIRDEPAVRELVAKEFNVLAPANAFKMFKICPTRWGFDYDQADAMVSFASENNLAVRATSLLWRLMVPNWAVQLSNKELEDTVKKYIQDTVGRYRGKVLAWDVGCELIDDSGQVSANFWRKALGEDYLVKAFRWAAEADPQVQLFYSDYRMHDDKKQRGIVKFVEDLRSAGAKIDGIACQLHHNYAGVAKTLKLKPFIQKLQSMGLKVHFSEVSVWISNHAPWAIEGQLQATAYKMLLENCLTNECPLFCVWGTLDEYAWRHPEQKPFLFGPNCTPKPAYYAVEEALLGFGGEPSWLEKSVAALE